MLNSRAGLETKFSPQFRTYSIVLMMAMRIAPVLLLFIILCSTVVQAVPVPTHPITTVAARYGVSSHDPTQLQLTSGSAYTGSLHHSSPIHLSPSKSIATSKEETSMVALARRRSLGWKIRHAFHVRISFIAFMFAAFCNHRQKEMYRTLTIIVANGCMYVLHTEIGAQNKAWYVLQ